LAYICVGEELGRLAVPVARVVACADLHRLQAELADPVEHRFQLDVAKYRIEDA
jgi:hypothetical protein